MCTTFYNVFDKFDKRFSTMVRRRESVDIGKHLYNVSINCLCTWFNNVFRKRFIYIYHCVSVSYAITMLRPPSCQSLSKVQCKYINAYICVYIAFKIQRKVLSCLELHFTPLIFCALTESHISSILFPITVHQNKMADFPFFETLVKWFFNRC